MEPVLMPTRHGAFEMRTVPGSSPGAPTVVLSMGLDRDDRVPLVRFHSECLTGDIFGSLRCDCGQQLEAALAAIAERGTGVLIYLRQEGRGIGLENKLAAYRLQDEGLDTVEANLALGLPVDSRQYVEATDILLAMGITRCDLLTNNPEKVKAVERSGVVLEERVELVVPAGHESCRLYLRTKRDRMGHAIPSC